MNLPKEAIDEFKKLYLKRFNIKLSDEEASYRAYSLLGLYDAIYGKIGNKRKK